MTTMPGKEEFRRNLEQMQQLEVTQADLFAEIVQMLSEARHKNIRIACQEIYEDELRHAKELENLLASL